MRVGEKITTEKESQKMHKVLYISMLCAVLVCCNSNSVYSEYQPITNAVWSRSDTASFTLSEIDSIQNYNVFINIRNDQNFPYSNLFLITSLHTPNGEVLQDTLEYNMALTDGTWLGKGSGSLKENKLWYKENIVFSPSGVYTIEVAHAMRKNGNVSGVVNLEGITDVGIEITKSKP